MSQSKAMIHDTHPASDGFDYVTPDYSAEVRVVPDFSDSTACLIAEGDWMSADDLDALAELLKSIAQDLRKEAAEEAKQQELMH